MVLYDKEEVLWACRRAFLFGASITMTLVLSGLLLLIYFDEIRISDDIGCDCELDFFKQMGRRFADSHEYVDGAYNCVNYSQEFMYVARSLGYDVGLKGGYNETNGHMWNTACFDYDPQNGQVAPNLTNRYPKPIGEKQLERYQK